MASRQTPETSSAPLADWFFISGQYSTHSLRSNHISTNSLIGVDSEQLRWGKDEDNTPSAPVEPTIEEDKAAEAEDGTPDPPVSTPIKAKRSSYQRLSNLSDEARLSISSLSYSPDKKGTESNRSSVTIKGIQVNSTGGLSDMDFENALKKFTSQRDSFLSDLTLSAGAVVPNRPKPRPKTQRITDEDNERVKSGAGSIRRRMSFRDMNSMKRQSTVKRQCECSASLWQLSYFLF